MTTVAAGYALGLPVGAAVVVVPGAASSRSAVLDQGVVLARHGYGVLWVDPRGTGTSDGTPMNLGWYGDLDLAAAVDYLATRGDVPSGRIGVLGESMGGEMAIGALGADRRVRAVVAEGATDRVAADGAWLPVVHGVRGRLQLWVDGLTQTLTDLLTPAAPPPTLAESASRRDARPLLLVAAGRRDDERQAGAWISGGAEGSGVAEGVQLWVVPDAGHTEGLSTLPQEWEERVVIFFDHALR